MPIFHDYTQDHYLTELRQTDNGSALSWNARGATHYLVVKNPFGKAVDPYSEAFQADVLAKWSSLFTNEPIAGNVTESVFIILRREEYRRNSSWTILWRPARYAVYPVRIVEDEETVFIESGANAHNQADVAIEIEVELKSIGAEQSLNGNVVQGISRYQLTLKSIAGASPTDLYYQVDDNPCHYPVTKEMLDRSFTVSKRPRVRSSTVGVQINEREV